MGGIGAYGTNSELQISFHIIIFLAQASPELRWTVWGCYFQHEKRLLVVVTPLLVPYLCLLVPC
jgi:hypothetical protein